MKFSDFLFILPFIAFLSGFFIFSLTFSSRSLKVPSLLGKNVLYGLQQASNDGFFLKILQQQESSDVAAGTIISQKPVPGASIKPKQTVFITVACEPARQPLPSFIGMHESQWQEVAAHHALHPRVHECMHTLPMGMVVAQDPVPGTVSDDNIIDLFVSSGPQMERIMPRLTGSMLHDVEAFLATYGITLTVLYEAYHPKRHPGLQPGIVIAQKPLPGSWVNLKKPLHVQVVALQERESAVA